MTNRPVSGRWFEELEVGTVVRHATRRTVTETDNVLFTTMTMNPAPMHLDADYAAGTEFGRPLVNSMFTVALVVGLSVPELTLGTIYKTLSRLEDKGLVTSRIGDPTPERGGRRTRCYAVTPAGRRELHASIRALRSMASGLGVGLEPI